ncbi:MAG: hypothetical protein ACYTDY_19075 [Planctomycetota bacterium]|jgi:hypothetical protein
MITTATKRCGNCQTSRRLVDFPRSPKRKDGRDAYCKVCRAEKARSRRRQAAGVVRETDDPTHAVVRDTAATEAATRPDSAKSAENRDWPVPLDPEKYPRALVERRLKTIAILTRLREKRRQGPNRGRRGPDGWQRRVYGDRREGGSRG